MEIIEKDKKDIYVRWQNIRITQLGFANNLIIGLAIASLAYLIDFLINVKSINFFQKFLFWFSCPLLLISSFLGIIVVLNRLEDFKKTAEITRSRDKNYDAEKIKLLKVETKKIGTLTWNLFFWQLATFFVGLICLIIIILITIQNKIT